MSEFIQVIGGCCCNVILLESLILNSSSSLGTVVTFCQFVFVSLFSYSSNTTGKSWKSLYLSPRVPLSKWFFMVLMYFSTSLLNNLVWKFNISIPMHIVFRSGSTAITMVVGYAFGKRYTRRQIISSITISLGIVMVSLPDDLSMDLDIDYHYLTGLVVLLVASVISAFLGIYNEFVFKQYGTTWQESLFYTHFLGLPFFLLVAKLLATEWLVLWKLPIYYKHLSTLAMNVITQYICVRGVNMLAERTSALTVTVVLLVRKVISLIISFVWFKNEVSFRSAIGIAVVGVGVIGYSTGKREKVKRE